MRLPSLLAVVCVLVLSTCGAQCQPDSPYLGVTSGGIWQLEIDEVSFPVGTVTLELYVVDADGLPAEGLDLDAEFAMKSDPSVTADVEVAEDEDGAYLLEADLFVAGKWLLSGELSNPSISDETFTFQVEVK